MTNRNSLLFLQNIEPAISSEYKPGGTQEAHPGAPRRHPGGTQEAPRGTQEPRGVLEGNSTKTYVFFCRKLRDRVFRCRVARVTLTKYRTCAQKLEGIHLGFTRETIHWSFRDSARTPSAKLIGE